MTQKVAIRSQIAAPKGYKLIQCDLSAAEAWVVAFLAHDDNMKLGLASDLHTMTARIIFEILDAIPISKDSTERYVGKRSNHANNYGQGPEQFARTVNKDSDKPPYVSITIAQAKQYSAKWHSFYRVKDWWARVQDQLRRDRTITTVYRRKRKFYGFWGDTLFKEAYAFEPQSTIADHMFGAIQPEVGITGGLREVYRQIVLPSNGEIQLVNTSHDSGILLCPDNLVDSIGPQFANILYRPMIIEGEEVNVPVDCEYGERWGELQKMKVTLESKSYAGV